MTDYPALAVSLANADAVEIILAIVAVLGIGKLLELAVAKLLNRQIDRVATDKVSAEVEQIVVTNNKTEVETVRAVLDEVKDHSATKDKRIDLLENTVFRLEGRIERMEAREHQAHQLTAAHETWDLQIYQQVLAHNPDFPPPPPLRAPLLVEATIMTEPREPWPETEEQL